MLTGGGRTLSYGIGTAVVSWELGSHAVPHVIMDIPGAWGDWVTTAPSPTKEELMAAGVKDGVPWLRMVTTAGDARMLLRGDQIDGWPLDGAISADGGRILLVVAKPDDVAPNTSSDWKLLDVAVADGSTRNTGVSGTFHAPLEFLAADFADDARSFVLWDSQGLAATRVDVAGGRSVPVTPHSRPAVMTGFRALPSGAAQLWDDGIVTLVDGDGAILEELDAHEQQVRDVVVAPDGTWAVTAGNGGKVWRWAVDPSTGRWSRPEPLPGHRGDVVGVDVDATGRTLFTVGLDSTVITWDMSGSFGVGDDGASRPFTYPQAWLAKACAVTGRDLSSGEWKRYLPDMPWEPTCSDLS
jgi:WD40 repeat protein